MGSIQPAKIPLWIDCDPGHDDACAILLGAYHPSMDLLGISTVYGNTSLVQTTYNARSILELIGKSDIPVFPGASQPFCRPVKTGEFFHGATGLAGTTLLPKPSSGTQPHRNVVEQMREALMSTPPQTAWLVAIGPLTNIALLFAMYPEVKNHIKGLSIMGGVIGDDFSKGSASAVSSLGTYDPYVEFNILCDPEAARAVFQSHPELKSKTTIIPLDLTHQVYVTSDRLEKIRSGGARGPTRLRTAFYELLQFCSDSYAKHAGLRTGAPLHDPLAVAALLFDCECSTSTIGVDTGNGESWAVDVDLEGDQIGRIRVTPSDHGVCIPKSIDVDGFWSVFEESLARADDEVHR